VVQAFDKVRHEGLFHKRELLLPTEYSLLLNSYLSGRYFRVKQDYEYTFNNRRYHHMPVVMNGKIITHSQTAKYVGMTLDAKLRWKVHIQKKREELGLT